MDLKKIILWSAGVIVGLALLAIAAFYLIIYFTMETPKDNDVIQRNLDTQKNQAQY